MRILKKSLISIIVLFVVYFQFTTTALSSELRKYSPKISEVKVYLSAAQITHSVKVTLFKGENSFLFCNLASSIENRSIVFYKFGAAKLFKLNLLEINDSTNILKLDPDIARLFSLKRDSLTNIENQIQKLHYELESLEIQKASINKFANPFSTDANSQSVKVGTNLLTDTYSSIAISLLEKRKELSDLLFARRSFISRIFGISHVSLNNTGITIMLVTINNESEEYSSELSFSYLSNEAAWNPVYEILTNENNPIKLNYNAKLLNNTGLDWDINEIRLSTADPFINYQTPNLTPNFIGRLRTIQDNQKENSNNSNKAYKNIKVPDREIDFVVRGKFSLLSCSVPYQINISEIELNPTFVYRTVPKKDAKVYIVARIPDWEKYDLIDGEATVFNNGNYLGKAMVMPSETEDSLEIPLGTVKNMIINYKRLSEYSSKKILGGDIVSTYTYEIKVKNNEKSRITLEILDQVPVSEESSVKADIIEITDGIDKDPLTGLVVWRKEINPLSELSFTLKYSVTYPRRGGYGIPNTNYTYRNSRFL